MLFVALFDLLTIDYEVMDMFYTFIFRVLVKILLKKTKQPTVKGY